MKGFTINMRTEIKSVMVHDKCGHDCEYSEKHDAHYCKDCNEWAITVCGYDTCSFCKTRPAKPSEVTK